MKHGIRVLVCVRVCVNVSELCLLAFIKAKEIEISLSLTEGIILFYGSQVRSLFSGTLSFLFVV